MTVRFDDLRPGQVRCFRMTDPVDVLVATDAAGAPAVLDAVEEAAAGGLWAAGFVTYEAAPGFDPALRVPAADGLPAAWFGLYRGRERAQPIQDITGRFEAGEWTASVSPAGYRDAVEKDVLSTEEFVAPEQCGEHLRVDPPLPVLLVGDELHGGLRR